MAMRWLVDAKNQSFLPRVVVRAGLGHVAWILILTGTCISMTGCATGDAAVSPASAAQPTAAEMESGGPAVAAIQLTNPATNNEIEGYASAVSVNRGEDVKLFVNTKEPNYSLDVFRIGWYNGRGMRQMTSAVRLAGVSQPAPYLDPSSGLIECNWRDPYVLHIPGAADRDDWPSGIYVARLTAGTSGKQS